MTGRRIGGILLALWGGGMIARRLVSGAPAGTGAYQAGANAALIIAALLIASGLYLIFKAPATK